MCVLYMYVHTPVFHTVSPPNSVPPPPSNFADLTEYLVLPSYLNGISPPPICLRNNDSAWIKHYAMGSYITYIH